MIETGALNPFLKHGKSTKWTQSIKQSSKGTLNRFNGLKILDRHFPKQFFSTALWWDPTAKGGKGAKGTCGQPGRKTGKPLLLRQATVKKDDRYEHPCKDFYIQCTKLFVVDLDFDTDLCRRALEIVGDRCNCVASTRKGLHLFFEGAVPELRAKQFDGLDVRTGDGKGNELNPDILFCAPSWYEVPGEGTARYEWIALPHLDGIFLKPPPELLELLRVNASVAPPTPGMVSVADKTVQAPTVQPTPPSLKDLVLPDLFIQETRPKGMPLRPLNPKPVITDFETIIYVDGAGKKGNTKGHGPASAAIVAYNVSEGTVETHTYFGMGTNNLTEHVGLLASIRRAKGKTLIINDSMLAHHQVQGIMKTNQPHLQALVNDSRLALEKKADTITFAHVDGHVDGKKASNNHADGQCTWARDNQACTGDASLFLHTVCTAKQEPIDTTNWLPSNLGQLSDEQVTDFWASLGQGDRFAIYWSHAETPDDKMSWAGEKLTPTSVNYLTEEKKTITYNWPPLADVRVHRLSLLTSATRKGFKGTRMKHVIPHTVVEQDIDQTLEMFKSFGTEEWVKWCMANTARRTLPTSHWFAWASIVKRFIVACTSADEEHFADAAHIFLGLPNLFLDKKLKNQQLGEALERMSMSRRLDGSAKKYQEEIPEEEKCIRQAQTLAEQGFIGKACKAIGTNRVLDGSSPAVQDVLKTKHPAGDFVMHDAPLPTMPYHAEHVQRAMRKLSNGAAPCWSGWTKEIMQAACRTDPELFHHFAVFLHRVRMSTDVRLASLMLTGKLIALNNARSPEDPDDPRPITISELFMKLNGLIAMEQSRWCIHPTQRGVNHKGGTHQAVVEIQRAYDANLNKIVATFDVSNAFNATMRAAIKVKLKLMGMSATELFEYFRWVYGAASDIYIRAKTELVKYRSCEGVRQGDMPASLLFSLVFTDAAVAAAGRSFDDVLQAMWLYLDDVTTVETVSAILKFKEELTAELILVGLSLNMAKCRALVDRCSPEDLARLIAAGFQIDRGCTRVLGSPIGDPAACRLWLINKVSKWQPFWEKVRHNLLEPFTALLILAKCGNCKFHHLAKSLAPEVHHDAAVQFDHMVDESINDILARRLESVDLHVRRAVARVQPYTVVGASLYECTLKMIAGERTQEKIVTHQAILEHYKRLPSTPFVGPLVFAVQGVTAADTFRPKTNLNAADSVSGLLLRHGVAPEHLPATCSCGHFFGHPVVGVAAIHHLMHCLDNVGKTHTTRHHEVVRAIQGVLATYGICSVRENQKLHPTLRPDIHVISIAKQVIIDVTVVDDVFHHNCDKEFLLNEARDVKHGHYDALAEWLKMDFYAVPMSSFGRLHSESHRFIEHIAHKCVNQFRRSDFKKDMRTAMQHALLKGTADVVNTAVARLSGKFADWIE